jgi:hypothetical protein
VGVKILEVIFEKLRDINAHLLSLSCSLLQQLLKLTVFQKKFLYLSVEVFNSGVLLLDEFVLSLKLGPVPENLLLECANPLVTLKQFSFKVVVLVLQAFRLRLYSVVFASSLDPFLFCDLD